MHTRRQRARQRRQAPLTDNSTGAFDHGVDLHEFVSNCPDMIRLHDPYIESVSMVLSALR